MTRASSFDIYQDRKILERDPFASLDITGVGQLVRMGFEKGRRVNPELKVGICGEHGGGPGVDPLLRQGRSGLRQRVAVSDSGGAVGRGSGGAGGTDPLARVVFVCFVVMEMGSGS